MNFGCNNLSCLATQTCCCTLITRYVSGHEAESFVFVRRVTRCPVRTIREAGRSGDNAHFGFSSAGRCEKVVTPPCPGRGCGESKLLSAHNNILVHVPHCSVQGKLDINKTFFFFFKRHNQGLGWRVVTVNIRNIYEGQK